MPIAGLPGMEDLNTLSCQHVVDAITGVQQALSTSSVLRMHDGLRWKELLFQLQASLAGGQQLTEA
jgi:hypothetical protein